VSEADTIERWLPRLIEKHLAFLLAEYDFVVAQIECFDGEVCARYRRRNLRVDVRWNFFEGILATSLVIASDNPGKPDVDLLLNLVLEARGRRDLWITQDMVGRKVTAAHADNLLTRLAASLRDYAADVLSGDYSVVPLVRNLLRDVPGDPRFDWWLSADHPATST
jgi:hypothetical protein